MRFYELFESTADYRPSVEEYLKKRGSGSSESVVTFSKSDIPESNGLGINVIPLRYFVNHDEDFATMIEDNQIIELEINSKILYVNKVRRNILMRHLGTLGVKEPTNTYDDIFSKSGYGSMAQSYGYVLHHVLERKINDGVVSDKLVSTNEFIERIVSLGYTGIIDTSTERGIAILSKDNPSWGYLFDNASYSISEVVGFSNIIERKPVEDRLFTLAEMISSALNTELNQDEPYHRGVDHYYWTYDGMQIRITESGVDEDSNSFVLDIETPYGILYHSSPNDASLEEISRSVEKRYKSMTEPLSTWRPLDRDVFLMNMTMDFKDWELKLEDIVKEVKKYYGDMRQFALRYDINIEPITFYSEYDMSLMSGIMDQFAKYKSAVGFVNKISDDGEMRDMRKIDDYFPRKVLPRKMRFEQLKKMAVVYDIAKKLQPKKSGWRVFYNG